MKKNVAMNAGLPQASYPCGNFSDTSNRTRLRPKWSIGKWPEYFSYDLFYVQQMKYKKLKHMALFVDVFSNYRVLYKSTSQWHRLSTDNMNTLQFGATSCAWENKNLDECFAFCNSKQRQKPMLGWLPLRRKQTRLVHLYENISKYGKYIWLCQQTASLSLWECASSCESIFCCQQEYTNQ